MYRIIASPRSIAAIVVLWAWLGGCLAAERPTSDSPSQSPSPASHAEARGRCADHDPLRNAYFGELHVHTGFSLDAFTFDTVATPDDAYRFARGEPLQLPGGRTTRLERPLDFTAVTEHASTLGELRLCTDPDSPAYPRAGCATLRGERAIADHPLGALGARQDAVTARGVSVAERSKEVCGEDGGACLDAMDSVWAELRRSAERFNDRSPSCRFTTFNGYEYTATPGYSKVHRNVIFRNENVPDRVVAWVDEPDRWGLWETLDRQCLQAGFGCDVLTIPHNSNMSNGKMFEIDYRDEPRDVQIERARLWQRLEPLVEIMQTKGDSECRNGMWKGKGGPDPLCDFEKWRVPEPNPEPCRGGTDTRGLFGMGCQSRLDFSRYALVEGLREAERIGVNPIKIGNTASTDMHSANPGDVAERSFDGVLGINDSDPVQRLSGVSPTIGPAPFNPGGLVGVWAEENSRDALFDAMKRRETFGTSGTRILPRFFGGWGYAADACDSAQWLEEAYAGGVAMGGDLPNRPGGAGAPRFIVSALRDPGSSDHPSLPLQRLQIIKAWPGQGNDMHQAIFDVAGDAASAASVDPDTCAPRGAGHDELCGVFTYPDFDPDAHAVYYARVIENPSCRWSTIQCNALPPDGRPPACSDPAVPEFIQERAWTSPIWYAPSH